MSLSISGHCNACGAPIWIDDSNWLSTTPPPPQYTCSCREHHSSVTTTQVVVSESPSIFNPHIPCDADDCCKNKEYRSEIKIKKKKLHIKIFNKNGDMVGKKKIKL